MSHLPEPWPPYELFVHPLALLNEADYRRARLCVNALAGVPDVTLEAANFSSENRALRSGLQKQIQRATDLKAERDAALAQLREHVATLAVASHQIEQMQGMFDDADGTIAGALQDIRSVQAEARKLLDRALAL